MATQMRLANKTIATLEDIMALTKQAQVNVRSALKRAGSMQDVVLMRDVAEIALALTAIERKAMINRQGGYAD